MLSCTYLTIAMLLKWEVKLLIWGIFSTFTNKAYQGCLSFSKGVTLLPQLLYQNKSKQTFHYLYDHQQWIIIIFDHSY